MGQLFVAQGTLVKCTQGRRIQQIAVSSQSTVKMVNKTKLAATEEDRFKDNFICPKMMLAGAIAGAAIAAALISTGPLALAVGAFAGSALIDDCINVCSLLCKGSQWSVVHPKVRFQGKRALLQDAKIHCFFGGVVHFEIFTHEQIKEIRVAAAMANCSYESADGDNSDYEQDEQFIKEAGYERIDTTKQETLDKLLGKGKFTKEDFNTNKDDGFYAALYYNSQTKQYFVAFRGSETSDRKTGENQVMQDWVIEDVGQALGFNTPQIGKTRKLAEKMNEASGGKVSFTGHSLGGGNSAMASYYTGKPGYTFNARGVHPNTLNFLDGFKDCAKSTSQIHSYNSSNDALNFIQNYREGVIGLVFSKFPKIGMLMGLGEVLPRALGEQNEIDIGGLNPGNLASGHSEYQKAIDEIFSSMNTTVYAQQL